MVTPCLLAVFLQHGSWGCAGHEGILSVCCLRGHRRRRTVAQWGARHPRPCLLPFKPFSQVLIFVAQQWTAPLSSPPHFVTHSLWGGTCHCEFVNSAQRQASTFSRAVPPPHFPLTYVACPRHSVIGLAAEIDRQCPMLTGVPGSR